MIPPSDVYLGRREEILTRKGGERDKTAGKRRAQQEAEGA
jgi:hypothetical protein